MRSGPSSVGAIGVVAAIALVFKSVYLWSYATSNPFYTFGAGDSRIYLDWARSINDHGWLGDAAFYQAPLYPYLLSLVFRALGDRVLPVYVLQLAMGVSVLGLVALAARRVYGGRAGVIAAVLCLGYAPFTFEETKILPTVAEGLLGSLFVYFLLRAEQQGELRDWLAGSVALGLAIVCRPNYAFVLPLLGALLLYRARRNLRAVAVPIGVLVLVPGLIVGAVAARNVALGGGLVLISANGGVTFAQGNNPRARGSMTVLPGFSGAPADQQREETAIAEREVGHVLTPAAVSRFWFAKGLRFLRDQPGDAVRLLGNKLALALSSHELGSNYLLAIDRALTPWLWLACIPFGLIGACAVVGLYLLYERRRLAAVVVATFVGTLLMLLLFYVNTRYRMTLLPAATILAAGAIDDLIDNRWRTRRTVAVLGTIGVLLALSLPPFLPFTRAELRRGDADYWANLGVAYRATGQAPGAIWAYDQAIARNPGVARYSLEKAEVLDAMGRHAEAAAIHVRLGARYLKAGRFQEAQQMALEGLRHLPGDTGLLYIHAEASFALGDRASALESIRQVVAKDSELGRARWLLEQLTATHP